LMSANFLLVAMIIVAKEVAKVATEEEVAMTAVTIEEVAVTTVVMTEEVVTEIVAQAEIARILLKKDADFLVK
jgi:hypothetical protein